MATNFETLCEAEEHAHLMAGLVEMSPDSFTLEQKRAILAELIKSKVAMENGMRESFSRLGEVEQTMLLDSLGKSGHRDREWWYRMLMDGPVHRDLPTL